MTALIWTLLVFALILVLARLKAPLALAIITGTAVLGYAFGLTGIEIAIELAKSLIQPRTISMAVITVFLFGLASVMRTAGQYDQIVQLAKQLLRRPAFAMVALPALIGLLPMPGGALFSAPMVQSAAGKSENRGEVLSAVNYWYRHIWEHWWCLYPGVILAVTLTGLSYGQFVAYQLPMGIFMIVTGLLIFRGTHPDLHASTKHTAPAAKKQFIKATSPIWIIPLTWLIASCIITNTVTPILPETISSVVDKYLPLTIGLITAIIWTAAFKKLSALRVIKILSDKSIYAMVLLVVSVMAFQYMLKQIGAAGKIADELMALKVPVVLVVVMLPTIAGIVTGLAIGFVGTSFPIILALVNSLDTDISLGAYVALAYGCGHIGQMISPLHLCYVVSNQYFKTGFLPVYRRLWPSVALNLALITAYFYVLKTFL